MSEFEQIWRIYTEAFPDDERRSLTLQRSILKNPQYHLRSFYHKKTLVGFLATWDLTDFLFIEHYAVAKKYRGQGYGENFLRDFLNQTDKWVVLEAEKPETVIAQKRIKFYERLHFHCNPYSYLQPPYESEKEAVPLLLMTYPSSISKDKFIKIKNKLYREVYKQV